MASSGMGAIATTLLSLCRAGDRIVAGRELYGDTRDLLVRDLPALGIRIDFVATADLAEWEAALAAGPAAVAYSESLSNPQLRVLDIPRVAELAHERGARLVVDNTFASAFTVQPLGLGADVVVHSATKFLNGHSDVVAGAMVADAASVREVQRRVVTFGTCLDPHAAFLVARALHTYELRLGRQAAAAAGIARWLEDSPEVVQVSYPGLASHPDAAVAERTWRPGRRGAMVAFVVRGGNERAARFLRALNIVREATSLGGVETLISAPNNSSHFSYTPQELNLAGIKPGLVRLSVGIEDAAESPRRRLSLWAPILPASPNNGDTPAPRSTAVPGPSASPDPDLTFLGASGVFARWFDVAVKGGTLRPLGWARVDPALSCGRVLSPAELAATADRERRRHAHGPHACYRYSPPPFWGRVEAALQLGWRL